MLLSQRDIESADLSFEPALYKRAPNRRIFLIAARGAILEGIKLSKGKGLVIPSILRIQNRPEILKTASRLEHPISDLTREVLACRIREELQKGIPLWQKHQRS